jgi:hypothetical protein
VQTADAVLRLKACLLKEGFYTAENRAVLALLDTHCEGFFSVEKTREAEERRKKQSDDAMLVPIEAPAAKQPRVGEAGVGAATAAHIHGVPLQNWQCALSLAAPRYHEDGGGVGNEYVFALLGPASPASHFVRDLPEVRETLT